MIDLVCSVCGGSFKRRLTEHKRCRRKNFKVVCGKECWAKSPKKPNKGNPENLQKGRERDEFSPFRKILRNALQRDSDSTLTLQIIKQIWENQNGICPYTGVKMVLHETSSQRCVSTPTLASLDRIDSKKGYTEDNVEFVCLFINLGKNGFSKESILDILRKK